MWNEEEKDCKTSFLWAEKVFMRTSRMWSAAFARMKENRSTVTLYDRTWRTLRSLRAQNNSWNSRKRATFHAELINEICSIWSMGCVFTKGTVKAMYSSAFVKFFLIYFECKTFFFLSWKTPSFECFLGLILGRQVKWDTDDKYCIHFSLS